MFSNNVKETSIFCQCFHKFLLIYNNVCLEKHQPVLSKKQRKNLKNLLNDIKILPKKKNIKIMVMIDIRIS